MISDKALSSKNIINISRRIHEKGYAGISQHYVRLCSNAHNRTSFRAQHEPLPWIDQGTVRSEARMSLDQEASETGENNSGILPQMRRKKSCTASGETKTKGPVTCINYSDISITKVPAALYDMYTCYRVYTHGRYNSLKKILLTFHCRCRYTLIDAA